MLIVVGGKSEKEDDREMKGGIVVDRGEGVGVDGEVGGAVVKDTEEEEVGDSNKEVEN